MSDGVWSPVCEVSPASGFMPAKFLHNNSDLDMGHVTFVWIGFGFTDLTFDNHVLLTSNLSKKSSQASSMSVTLTVTLTPRMELTPMRMKMHGIHISI